MTDVITFGTATHDVFLRSHDFKLLRSKSGKSGKGECLAFGSKIAIEGMESATGGGATNVAASLKQLGMRVGIVSRIGNDLYGDYILDDMRTRRIPVDRFVRDSQHATAHASILIMHAGDRTVFVYRGASENLRAEDIAFSKLKATWFFLSSIRKNLAVHKKIMAHAHKNNTFVAWNPGSLELSNSRKALAPLLKKAHVLFLNEEEARRLTGKVTTSRTKLLDALDAISPGINVITYGERGADISTPTERFHVEAKALKVVNTTGAGDAFGAGFVAGLIHSDDPRTAARVGVLNAISVIGVSGAKKGILPRYPSPRKIQSIKIDTL